MAMMAVALALIIAAVVASVALRGGEPGRALAGVIGQGSQDDLQPSSSGEEQGAVKKSSSEDESSRYSSGGESLGHGSYSGSGGPVGQGDEQAGETQAAGAASDAESSDFGSAGERTPSGTSSESSPHSQPDQAHQGDQTLPAAEDSGWPKPAEHEIAAANAPRHYELLPGAIMSLTIKAIGIYDAPVFDSDSPWALARGVAHTPGTSLPWSNTPQRNVYLSGHRMGYRGTWSRMLFYNLDELSEGDEVVLRDRSGRAYKYKVSEIFLADPTDMWVMGQVRGRDMVTLQTCTPIPTFEKRLIVRADRV
jgi:sortase A